MIHPESAGVTKASIRAQIGKKFKVSEDRVAVFGVKPKYGGGRSSCFVSIYDDVDARKKYDTKTQLFRVSITINSKNACQLSGIQNGAFSLSILLFSNLKLYFNRTKLLKESRGSRVSLLRSLRARERRSRVLPSPRSSPVRRRSDQGP